MNSRVRESAEGKKQRNKAMVELAVVSPWVEGGRWMRALREGSQITLKELAEQVGAPSGAWMEQLEAGMRPVPSSFYIGFAKVFGMKARDFAARCLKYYDAKAYEALFLADSAEVVAMQARAA